MASFLPITIVGGGLAGLSLGLALRRYDVPVTIWEAGTYPRHRVCGEFLNGRGAAFLAELGLEPALKEAGAQLARTTLLFWGGRCFPLRCLPTPAISISRYVLDDLLARAFIVAGGDLRTHQRWTDPQPRAGLVRASGRRAQPPEGGWRWFGLKAHFRNLPLGADLEMHARRDGYVGLCRLPAGIVNVCGLFRRSARTASGNVSRPKETWLEILRGPPGSHLHSLLATASPIENSFCAVAGLPLPPRRAHATGEVFLGDALAMIPPISGNGMSMALESAAIAWPPLVDYSRGSVSWNGTVALIAAELNRRFASRLVWAQWLQRLLLSPAVSAPFAGWLLSSNCLFRLFLRKTR